MKESNKKRMSDIKQVKVKYKEKSKVQKDKDIEYENPPKKSESLKIQNDMNENIKTSEDLKLVNRIENKHKRRSIKGSKRRKTALGNIEVYNLSPDVIENNNNRKNNKKNSNIINSKVMHPNDINEEKIRAEDLDMYELNELDYDEAY